MQELIAMAVLLLALVVVIVGFQIKPITSPVLQAVPQQPIQPQVVPIYFPRPMYPFPRLGYPIRQFPPPIRPPIKLN
ncbi:hypothetical protein IIV25_173L [Invertebrate iridovirus 25]|uniref:Uncharacterized protein n=1 Tax=Invertebrate iridovirus 25 TaxID=1301280 RepID=W8W245_9VIRU|nr:hypothetical protein IIV25_173L [Invertebrate iridovirus 25]CCV02191.1 hypothetical protein IIV25_173L [Invertebrate iridovirus 25]